LAREAAAAVTVLGIDEGESPDTVSSYVREHRLTYPILLDEKQEYGRAYAAVGLPTTIIVGRDGKIMRGIDGPMSLAGFRAAVAPALAARLR
jgi:peroxiredoxin